MAENTKTKKEVNNLSLWEAVGVTDVRHTKQVTFGRKFTAIDAYSQIMKATEIFGLYGQGWGVRNPSFWNITPDGNGMLLGYSAELFYNYGGKEGVIPIDASIFVVSEKGKFDEDCVKKVSTDALTKGLSKLGFNADVFLGKFDDNKYVAKLKQAESEKESAAALSDLIKSLDEASSIDIVRKLWNENPGLKTNVEFKDAVARNGKRLTPESPLTETKPADEGSTPE